MSFRTTAVLAALLVILGAVFYFTEVRGGKQDPDEAKRLFRVAAEEVEAIELRTPREAIALRRDGDRWQMESPLRAPGDRAAVTALVTSLADARADRTLEGPPGNPADFGLDRIDLAIRFKVKGDARERRLDFGGKSPTGAWAYARKDGQPEVILVPERLRGELNKSVFDLRDKTVLAVQADAVTRLVIHRPPGQPVELARNGEWTLLRPVRARADQGRASGLVRQVGELKAKAFVAEPATDLRAFGLDRPPVRLELWEGEAKAPRALALARDAARPEIVYARAEPGMTVVTVDAAILEHVPSGPWDIRDKRLLRFAHQDVRKVRIAAGDRAVAVEREGDRAWKVVEPAAGPAAEPRVTDLLSKLAGLRAVGVAAEEPTGLERFGLDRPQMAITLTKGDGKEIGTLLVGVEDKERRYVQIKGEAPVYTLPARDLQDLPRAPDDFREKPGKSTR